MKKLTFPKIGRFKLVGDDETGEHVEVIDYEPGRGVFDSYLPYIRDLFMQQVKTLEGARYECRQAHIPVIRKWVEEKFNGSNAEMKELFEGVPIVLTHNDLTLNNVLAEGTKITGVVDWEWGGAFPLDEDWIGSIEFITEGEDTYHPEHSPICEKVGLNPY